jgi:D-lactate dehydrogenase
MCGCVLSIHDNEVILRDILIHDCYMKCYCYETQDIEKNFFEQHKNDVDFIYKEHPLNEDSVTEDAEIVTVFVNSKVTKEVLDKMPKLTFIATRSTGFNHIDIEEAERRDITVVSVPAYGEHTVAEYAFGSLLSLTRKIPEAVKMTRENICIPPELVRGVDLCGKTIGIIGAGRIGKKMIAMAKGFSMNVVVYDEYKDQDSAAALGYVYTSFDDLLIQSDVISIHMPLTDLTHHMLNKEAFLKMKKDVYIINTARGELIDTAALIDALVQNKIKGCALDVCEGEELLIKKCSPEFLASLQSRTLLKESAHLQILKSMPNVLLSPHIAYDTEEALIRICSTTIESVCAYINHEEIKNKVSSQPSKFGKLVIVRHTESEWNKEGKWTGSRNVHLSMKGFEDARLLGLALEGIHIDHAFASEQVRTMETLSSMLGTMRQPTVPITRDSALNERDYGEYTGKNKHDMKVILGDEQFEKVRRGYDVAIPHGETLKMVYERVSSYFVSNILPRLEKGQTVLIVSHGNALRALMKYIEKLSDEQIEHTEMMFGGALVYTLSKDGGVVHKELRETPSRSYDYV